jgi:hypothetical protein
MLARPLTKDDGGMPRAFLPGDILGLGETIDGSLVTAGSGTILASSFAIGILRRTGPGGAYNDTTDTAQNIVNALAGVSGNALTAGGPLQNPSQPEQIQVGTTLRFIHVNTVAFIMTLVAGVGVVLGVGVTANAASSWREYLVTVLNSTPTVIVQGNVTNGSAIVTGLTQTQTNQLTPGMYLPAATGITAGTTILSVQPGVGFTMNANGTATNNNVAITATPLVKIDGIRSGLI